LGEIQLQPQFTITRMQVGDFEVPVPVGLSELLNQAGAWGPKREPTHLKEYDRRVEMRDGKLFTVLTKIT
jgi:hypothetical protein